MIPWKEIDLLAEAHAQEPVKTEDAIVRFLKYWWCTRYNRPFLDPLLETYTNNDLAYEFLRHHHAMRDPEREREAAAAAEKLKADEEWAKKMVQKVAEEERPKPPDMPPVSTNFGLPPKS